MDFEIMDVEIITVAAGVGLSVMWILLMMIVYK